MKNTCPLGITQATIVSWRDHALDSAAAARLNEHMQSCAACAGYRDVLTLNAHLLRAQPLPLALGTVRRQDRLWRDVRGHITHEKERNASMHQARPTLLRGAAMVIGVIVIITLGFGAIQLLSRRAQIASHTTPAVLHVSTANGSTVMFPPAFYPSYISPDGDTIIGIHYVQETDPSGNGSAVFYGGNMIERYSVSSQKLDSVYTTSSDHVSIDALTTDGRYIAWVLDPPIPVGATNTTPTVTPSQLQLMTLDLQTMHVQMIAQKVIQGDNVTGDYICHLDHGVLFWQDMYDSGSSQGNSGGMLKMTNLATNATTTLSSSLIAMAIAHTDEAFQESWPYVILATGVAHEQFMDVTTGAKQALLTPPFGDNVDPSYGPQYQLDGATVVTSWVTITGGIDFAQIDTTAPNARWQTIAAIAQPFTFPGTFFQVNSRLLVFTGATTPQQNNVDTASVPLAWDRHLRRLLEFTLPNPPTGLAAELFGNWLLLTPYKVNQTAADQQPIVSTLIDTQQLLAN